MVICYITILGITYINIHLEQSRQGTDVTVRMHAQKGDLQYARVLVRNTNTNRSDLYNMEKVSTITVDEEQVDIWEATSTPDEIGVYGYKFIAGDGDTVKYYCEDGSEGKTGTVEIKMDYSSNLLFMIKIIKLLIG